MEIHEQLSPAMTQKGTAFGVMTSLVAVLAGLSGLIGLLPFIGMPFAYAGTAAAAVDLIACVLLIFFGRRSRAIKVALVLSVGALLLGFAARGAHQTPGYDHWSFG